MWLLHISGFLDVGKFQISWLAVDITVKKKKKTRNSSSLDLKFISYLEMINHLSVSSFLAYKV